MDKITIVGAGRVGETTAQIIAEQDICREVVLLDVREDVPQGVALDIYQTASLFKFDTTLSGSHEAESMTNSDIVIITAGVPRKPGMSRSDVLETNLAIIDQITDDIMRYAPNAIVIMVTNPVDVLTYRVWQKTQSPRHRILGQAGILDASRMAAFIALETGFSTKDITTIVLGGHGDSMVPMPRFCTINGIPISHFIPPVQLQNIIQRTRDGGAEILALRQISSAYDAPGAAVAEMVEAIARNRKRLLPCVAILDGEYGHNNIAMGVPATLERAGLSQVIELKLNSVEQQAFDQSANAVADDISRLAIT